MSEESHDGEAEYTTDWGDNSPAMVDVGRGWVSYRSACPHCHRLVTQTGVEVPPASVRPSKSDNSYPKERIQFRCFEVCSHDGAPSEKALGCGVNWWGMVEP